MQQDTQRRAVLGAGAAFIGWQSAVAGQTSQPSAVDSDSMTVTLLGTGSPVPVPDRFGMATLVQAGGLNLMFDAGRGCSIRLNQAGVPMGSIDGVFITHFHSDHLNGLPDMWMTGYLNTVYARRRRPLEIIGPRGIARIAASMRDCYADDIRIRMADEKVAAASTEIAAHEFDGDGVVFDRNGVRVTAFAVDHGALIKPACGYRIDHGGRSVLLSGDTRFDENLIARGQGVELLVHEVAVAPVPIQEVGYIKAILDHHTSPEEVGTVFARTRPRLGVFSHIVKLRDEANPPLKDGEIAQRARSQWDGEILVGADLDRFTLTAAGVAVQHFDHARGTYPV